MRLQSFYVDQSRTGSRCVSYILYMPMPQTEDWKPEWGGALELYPVKPGPDGILEPESIPSKSIPPSWNQFVFFEVQPGRSFHSVEEVTIDEGDCARQRLSISGWFHKAQEGEEGYEGKVEDTFKSSLEQLVCTHFACRRIKLTISFRHQLPPCILHTPIWKNFLDQIHLHLLLRNNDLICPSSSILSTCNQKSWPT